jgi:hypothetical protein
VAPIHLDTLGGSEVSGIDRGCAYISACDVYEGDGV